MNLLSVILVFLGSFVALSVGGGKGHHHRRCPQNQEYQSCGSCDRVCNQDQGLCTTECIPGCHCCENYYREYPSNTSACVLLSQCPDPPECGINEKYSSCNGCDQTCNEKPIGCAAVCGRPGCYCAPGFKRAYKGGNCVPENKCPARCGVNEVFDSCGKCDQICNSDPIACSAACNRPGCYCKPGFKRSFKGGICIEESKCPARCGVNEVFDSCGKCDQICNSDPIFCSAGCNRPGCYCKPGFKRSFKGGICIEESKCVPQCNLYEVYKRCGGCDQICNRDPVFCTFDCKNPGCYCQNGYVRSFPGGICIPPRDCPQVSVPVDPGYQCGKNEVYNSCGVGWQCEDYCGRGPNACAYCEPGCYCAYGYIRDGPEYDAVCIPKNQCPIASVPKDPGYQCGKNEVYNSCGVGWQCEDYCGRGPNACAYCEPGCYCAYGYIRDGPEYDAVCIPKNQCPQALPPQDPGYQCGKNEVYNSCGVGWQCEDYCGRGPNACAYCEPGCYCAYGYVRDGPEYDAVCIPKNKCPRALDVVPFVPANTGPSGYENPPPVVENSGPSGYENPLPVVQNTGACGQYEVYQSCGVGKECENYCGRGPFVCNYCRPGCYCINGYIRASSDYYAPCILENQCYSDVGNPPVMENAGPSGYENPPPVVENSGPSGYENPPPVVQNSDLGPPIGNSFSQGSDSGDQSGNSFFSQGPRYQCRPNEVFDGCGVGQQCEDYCGRGANACDYCKPGCYCKQGLVRAGPSNRTICVPKNNCPVAMKCLQNEVYKTCGTACPDSCDSRDRVCSKQCVVGCFCKSGYIRIHDDTQYTRYNCIPTDQCPVS